jgi:predicted RNA-binding protein with RPS1 domain
MNGDLNLATNEHPTRKAVFVISPYGLKGLFDFDEFYRDDLAPVIVEAGCTPVRADSIYGPESLIGTIWTGLQRCEIAIVDFTGRSPNVALECGWAILLRKKMIILTQEPEDIPTDLRGRFRHIRYSDRHKDVRQMREELLKQIEALLEEPLREMGLVPVTSAGTDVVPGVVVTTTAEFAVIEATGGQRGVLANTDVDYARVIPDMGKHFAIGERVSGAFDVDAHGVPKYTLLAGVPNPWARIREDLPKGKSLTGTVRATKDNLGVFVDVGNGLSGLIHTSALGGRTPTVGDQVDVTVRHVDVDRRRIALDLDWVRPAARRTGRAPTPRVPARTTDEATFRPGQRLEAEVQKVVMQPEGGYLLVRVPGRTALAMLHNSDMTPELRDDLADDEVEVGELLDVEVVSVDPDRGRLCLRDLPDGEDAIDEAVSLEASTESPEGVGEPDAQQPESSAPVVELARASMATHELRSTAVHEDAAPLAS